MTLASWSSSWVNLAAESINTNETDVPKCILVGVLFMMVTSGGREQLYGANESEVSQCARRHSDFAVVLQYPIDNLS